MDIALQKAHGAGYTFLVGFILAVAALVFSGCPFAQKQYELVEPVTTEDGTTYPVGTKVWADAEGEPTFDNTGTPYMETDVEGLEKVQQGTSKLTDLLPYGIGGLIVLAGVGAINAARKSRAKNREEANAKLKKGKAAA
jgi:hypothetical protein